MATPPARPIGPFPWRPRGGDLLGIVLLFAATRLLLIVIGVHSWEFQVRSLGWRGIDSSGIRYALVPNRPMLDMWTRWDSWEYEEIARKGYWYDPNLKPRPYGTVACFPFYPLTIRVLGVILGGNYVVAGLIIANASAVAGFVLLFQWAIWWGDRRCAWLTVSSAIAFPAGLFWSALYPQSLYFGLSVAALTLMLDGRVIAACLVASAATATRLEGIALVPTLLAILLQRTGGRVNRDALWVLVTPLGLASYMAYLYWWWGDPALFLKIHAIFGRGVTNPLVTLVRPLTDSAELSLDGVVLTYVVGALLILGTAARLKWPILLYGWLLFLIPLCTGTYLSIYRVHLVSAPIYLSVGLGFRGRWRLMAWGLLAISVVLQAGRMFSWAVGHFRP